MPDFRQKFRWVPESYVYDLNNPLDVITEEFNLGNFIVNMLCEVLGALDESYRFGDTKNPVLSHLLLLVKKPNGDGVVVAASNATIIGDPFHIANSVAEVGTYVKAYIDTGQSPGNTLCLIGTQFNLGRNIAAALKDLLMALNEAHESGDTNNQVTSSMLLLVKKRGGDGAVFVSSNAKIITSPMMMAVVTAEVATYVKTFIDKHLPSH